MFGRLEEVLVMGLRMTDGIDHKVNPFHGHAQILPHPLDHSR